MKDRVVKLPDLDLGRVTLTAGAWLAAEGVHLVAGDRLLEIIAGPALIDISSPVSGTLLRQLVEEDQQLHEFQPLAEIRPDAPADD